jgi:predicted nucleotidyltransferase
VKFGLPEKSYALLCTALQRFPEIQQAIIFGSRAMGSNKPGSDVDIALKGAQVTAATVLGLSRLLNDELPLPHHYDICDYQTLTNDELKKHIDSFGKPID